MGVTFLWMLLTVMLWSWSWTIEAQVLQPGTTCKIMTFIPFTDRRDPPPPPPPQNASQLGSPPSTYGYGTWIDPVTQAKAAFSLMAAAELARYHFNTRDTTIVPELGQLNDCPITMPDPEEHEVKYLDSGYDKISTVRTFDDTKFILDQIDGMNNGGGNVSTLDNSTWLPQHDRHFCALIGPVHPYVVDGISSFAVSGRIPLITYQTTSAKFSSQREYPFYASTIPNAYDFGEVISKAFRDIWTREGVGILYDVEDFSDFGVQLERPLREFIETFDHRTVFVHTYQFEEKRIQAALSSVKSKGYRTLLILNNRPASIKKIAQIADSMNMIGPGYFWLLMGAAFRPSTIQTMKYAVDSPMDRLLRGAALFTNYDRSIYGNQNDPFLATWKTQNVLSIDQLNQLQPLNKVTAKPYYAASESYFQDEVPSEYASYMYDAVILAGISVCNDYKRNFGNGNFTHIEEIRRTEFTGASGRVRFAPKDYVVEYDATQTPINQLLSKFKTKSSRDPQDTIFGIYNIQRGDVDSQNMQSYKQVLTHLYTHDIQHVDVDGAKKIGTWEPVADASFLFFDGTTNEPMPRRDVYDANYLAQGVQIAGLIMAGVAFTFVFGTGICVFANREHELIKAGQPGFLYLLCFGAALVASSLIFVSFDESDGLSVEQLSGMCSAFPWFFINGYLIMYCALLCKLWRLSKLMQMRRKAVLAKQVLLPFLMIMGCCNIILIVWQVMDPVKWVREGINEKGQPYETYGECNSVKYGMTPFLVPIFLLMSISVTATAVFSFKLRHVQSELSESSWIFGGIVLHIQMWLVGVPVLFITNEISKNAFYVMTMILTCNFSASLVVFVIGPKVYNIVQDRYFGDNKEMTKIAIGGGKPRVSGMSDELDLSNYNSSSNNLSHSESESLRHKIVKLTMEIESLKMHVTELEEAVQLQNNSPTFTNDDEDGRKMIEPPERSPCDFNLNV